MLWLPDKPFVALHYGRDELVTANPKQRLRGFLFDAVLLVLTLGVFWLLWFAIAAPRGQTSGKQVLHTYVLRADGTRAGGVYSWFREFVPKFALFMLVPSVVLSFLTANQFPFTLALLWAIASMLWWAIGGFSCVFNGQCLWDKVASTHVAYSPGGFRPKTARELRRDGVPAEDTRARRPSGGHREQLGTLFGASGRASLSAVGDVGASAQALRALRGLLDDGRITQEEYEERRSRLVDRL